MVRKVGSKWKVLSADGSKTLGTYDSKEKAVERLRQIEFWKNAKPKGGKR